MGIFDEVFNNVWSADAHIRPSTAVLLADVGIRAPARAQPRPTVCAFKQNGCQCMRLRIPYRLKFPKLSAKKQVRTMLKLKALLLASGIRPASARRSLWLRPLTLLLCRFRTLNVQARDTVNTAKRTSREAQPGQV